MRRRLKLLLLLLIPTFTFSAERELLGVHLGDNYATTLKRLTSHYGKPVESKKSPVAYDAFLIGKSTDAVLIVRPSDPGTNWVSAVQVEGTLPVPGLGFLSGINLGDADSSLPLALPGVTEIKKESDELTLYSYDWSNFSIESRQGKIASILITAAGLNSVENKASGDHFLFSMNELKSLTEQMVDKPLSAPDKLRLLNAFSADPLRDRCLQRYPLQFLHDLPIAWGSLASPDLKSFKPVTFLLDTGYSVSTLTSDACKASQCKVGKEEELGPGMRLKQTLPGFLSLGLNAFTFPNLYLDDNTAIHQFGAQAVAGSDVWMAKPIVINFLQEYICIVEKPLEQALKGLNFKKLKAQYDAGRIWIDFQANGKPVKDYFLDTGADATSFLKKDFAALGLSPIRKGERINLNGKYPVSFYGPLRISLAGFERKLTEVADTSDPQFRKIGQDVLHSSVLGIDRQSGWVYLGP